MAFARQRPPGGRYDVFWLQVDLQKNKAQTTARRSFVLKSHKRRKSLTVSHALTASRSSSHGFAWLRCFGQCHTFLARRSGCCTQRVGADRQKSCSDCRRPVVHTERPPLCPAACQESATKLTARCNMRHILSGSSCGVPIRIGPRNCRGIQFVAKLLGARGMRLSEPCHTTEQHA